MAAPTSDEAEFHSLLGQVVEIGAQLEHFMASTLATMVSGGVTRVGLLVVAGESVTWVTGKIERIGNRYPDQVPGLAEWAVKCRAAFEKRNRVVHDWFAEDGEGNRTAIRFTRRDSTSAPKGLEQRSKAIEEIREALEALKRVDQDFTTLTVRLGARLWSLNPDA